MKIIRPVNITTTAFFSRGSYASYFDKDGNLQYANPNVVRINYDPVTLEMKGPLIELQATNLVSNNMTITNDVRTVLSADAPAGTYTLSFYGTGTIDLTGSATETVVGTGVLPTRTTRTFVKTTGDITVTVTGTVTNIQIESGSTATSFIPHDNVTYTSKTRLADVITGNGLVYSNVPETEYNEWVSATSYSVGDRVMRQHLHKVYQNFTAGVNATPPESDTTGRWVEIGPTNTWALFDELLTSVTSNVSEIVVVIKPGRVSGLALLGLDATFVEVAMTVEGETVYSGSADLLSGNTVGDWYEYFYEPIYQQDTLVITELVDSALLNLPQYGEGVISVRIKYEASTAKCAALVVGLVADIGLTQHDSGIGIVDYSKIETDGFGRTQIVKRAFSKRSNVDVLLKNNQVDNVARILSLYRATPIVWVGTDNIYNSMVIYGFYRDWEVSLSNEAFSKCSIQIEGLAQ